MRNTRDSFGSFPNATCDDHSDGSQEQFLRRQDQIYYTSKGDSDLCNGFEGPWRGFAPVRKIILTQGSHHILELEGTWEVNWLNLLCCEGVSSRQTSLLFLMTPGEGSAAVLGQLSLGEHPHTKGKFVPLSLPPSCPCSALWTAQCKTTTSSA